jgi:hypothetical protein
MQIAALEIGIVYIGNLQLSAWRSWYYCIIPVIIPRSQKLNLPGYLSIF